VVPWCGGTLIKNAGAMCDDDAMMTSYVGLHYSNIHMVSQKRHTASATRMCKKKITCTLNQA
jgi:hypothetical protein